MLTEQAVSFYCLWQHSTEFLMGLESYLVLPSILAHPKGLEGGTKVLETRMLRERYWPYILLEGLPIRLCQTCWGLKF